MQYTPMQLREIIAPLAAQYGAKRIYLFGSCARGEMHPGSDIDLRIDKGRIHGVELGGLLTDLEEKLGLRVDLIPTGSLNPDFLRAIQKDEVLLYEAG